MDRSTDDVARHQNTEPEPVHDSASDVEGRRMLRRRLGLLRGILLLGSSFCLLVAFFLFAGPSPAQNRADGDEPDFPFLFRSIDRRLQESYLDLDRVDPEPLLRKALSALESAADEIYVEDTGPANPFVPVHVGDKTQVFALKKGMKREQAVRLLESVFEFLQLYYHGDRSLNELRYAAANGYLSGIDPHTLVFTPKGFEEFEVHIKGEIFGVGMLVGTNDHGRLEVKQVIKETPAYKAGFKRGDLIAKIDDESTINMSVNEAVKKIRGPRQTAVTLTVKREVDKDGEKTTDTIPISVKRDRVEIKSVGSKLITGQDNGDSPWKGGVGYIKCNNFDQNTFPSLRRELNALRRDNGDKPLAGLVLDLRGNSGGLLTQAIKMANAFLTEGEIVGTASKNAKPQYNHARAIGTEPEYPIIVLADEGSASGAEIVIGALQKNNRALVIGTRTFGKGSVQQLQALPNDAQLKITVSEYLLPGEVSIQETGVVPDIETNAVYLGKSYVDLFPDEATPTERDYEAHLVSKYKTHEEPRMSMKYLWKSSEDDDGSGEERRTLHERFISGELEPEKDALVRVALRLLTLAEKPFSPRQLLTREKENLEALGASVYDEIVDRLATLDVDWSAGPPSDTTAEAPDLDLTLTHEHVEEPSTDKDDPVPINTLVVKARLTNNGKQAVFRIKGLTRSEYFAFEEKELLFGKIRPGQTIEREVKIRLPYYPRAMSSVISLDVSGPDEKHLASRDEEIVVEGRQRPSFAYTARLLEDSGEEITRLGAEVHARLALTITNVGESKAHKGIAILRNKSGRRVFLEKGRIEFENLEADASTEIEFAFATRDSPDPASSAPKRKRATADSPEGFEFDLVIVDSYSSATLSRTIDISGPGKDGEDFPNGRKFRAPTIEMALLSTDTTEEVSVTESDSVDVKAKVTSTSESFQTWSTTLALTPKTRNPDKFFFDESRGRGGVEFRTPVELADGMNLVTVTAKDRDGIESRRSLMIRKRKAGLP